MNRHFTFSCAPLHGSRKPPNTSRTRGMLWGVTEIAGELDGLRALARCLVHGDADADDLVQDTAVAALAHPPAGERGPWLRTVLRNRWRASHRAASRREAREAAIEPLVVETPADSAQRARVIAKLSDALVALDEPLRVVVMRRYFDGESSAAIARALGVPAGTVRWRLKAGLDRLRAALDEERKDWRAMLAMPLAKGLTIMKVKTTVAVGVALVALAIALISGAFVFSKSKSTDDPATGPAVSSGTRPRPIAKDEPVAQAAASEPPPGQNKPVIAAVEHLPGGAVGGRVINWSTGDGVEGAELEFSDERGGTTQIKTGANGGFAFEPTAPGAFTLLAAGATGFLPYAPELAHSNVVAHTEADRAVRGITIFLFPAVDYHGVVVDAAAKPVKGAHVKLVSTPQSEQVLYKLASEWTTDANGEFVFHAPDGAVFEAALDKARGWGVLDRNVALSKRMMIRVDAGVKPRVETIAGRVVDDKGDAVPDVLVRAEPEDEAQPPRSSATAMSGVDGRFVLSGLDERGYALITEVEDRAPTILRGVKGGAKDVTLVASTGAVLAGTVLTSDRQPVGAYTLLVMKREGAGRELIVAKSIVDARGKFSVHVPPGDYDLTATATGSAPSAPVTATAPKDDLALMVTEGGTLRGMVVDAATGAPLQYARVMREAVGGGASAQPANAGTVTRDDGTFELTGIPPGSFAITIGAGGYHPKIEAGLTATDGQVTGPVKIALTVLAEGETPKLELVGIGVQLRPDGDALSVIMVVPQSGAEAAGIVVGDKIATVDGAPVAQIGLDGAIQRIRGVEGTKVAIGVVRQTGVVPLVVERRKIRT